MAVLQITVPLTRETRVRLKLFKLVCVAPWLPFRKRVARWLLDGMKLHYLTIGAGSRLMV
jgi:hypothetical protein